jgi:hypothetical protein
MRRRRFLNFLDGAASWPLFARAQQPTIPVAGLVSGGSADASARFVAAFRQGLAETGYVETLNVTVEYRCEGQQERLPESMSVLCPPWGGHYNLQLHSQPNLRRRRSRLSLLSAEIQSNLVLQAKHYPPNQPLGSRHKLSKRRDEFV